MASKIVNTNPVYLSYEVKLRLTAISRAFSANQKARIGLVGAENLLISDILLYIYIYAIALKEWKYFGRIELREGN